MLFYFKIKRKALTPQFLNLQSTSESYLSLLHLLTSNPSPRPVDCISTYISNSSTFLFPLPPPRPAVVNSYFVYSSGLPTHLVFTLVCFIDFILLFTVYIKSCHYHLKNSPEVSRSTYNKIQIPFKSLKRSSVVWSAYLHPPHYSLHGFFSSHFTPGPLHFLFPFPGKLVLWFLQKAVPSLVSRLMLCPQSDLSCSFNQSSLFSHLLPDHPGFFPSTHMSNSKITLQTLKKICFLFESKMEENRDVA